MGNNIVLSTADDIVAVIDAINAKGQGADHDFISEFTGILNQGQTDNALKMAIDLQLIKENTSNNTFEISSPFARLLSTAIIDDHKSAIMRIILEQYAPFDTFKSRFAITQNIELACKQTKTIHSMSSSERDIKNTIISMATYSKILKRTGANTYHFYQGAQSDHLQYIDEIIELKLMDEMLMKNYFGDTICQFADDTSVIRPLIDAIAKSKGDPLDTKAVILYAGNAFESFLGQFAQYKNVSLQGKNGIISKLTAFNSNDISKKHRGIIECIGQIRNAADHGTDQYENNMTWTVSKETAIMYPLLVASIIKNIIQRENGIIEV